MAKILPAEATAAGVVSAMGFVLENVLILGEGKQASTGILLMDGADLSYIPLISGDIKTTIEKVIAALGPIASALQAIGTGMTGSTTAPPPTLGTLVGQINTAKAELETLKEALK